MQPIRSEATRHRLLAKLVREVVRAERRASAIGDARRPAAAPPAQALARVACHADQLAPRLAEVLAALELRPGRGGRLGIRLAARRYRAIDGRDPARATDAYQHALAELHHAIDVVRVLRDVARLAEHFALIRWCDDWLAARRPLVAEAVAQRAYVARRRADAGRLRLGDRRATLSEIARERSR